MGGKVMSDKADAPDFPLPERERMPEGQERGLSRFGAWHWERLA